MGIVKNFSVGKRLEFYSSHDVDMEPVCTAIGVPFYGTKHAYACLLAAAHYLCCGDNETAVKLASKGYVLLRAEVDKPKKQVV